jgi:DNA-binding Lrp family transcriptional regulator
VRVAQSIELPNIEQFDLEILDVCQRGFPVVDRPFAELARRFDCDESTLIERISELCEAGVVSRVGPVLAPGVFGSSTLAAISVPADRMESVADTVSAFAEVNHNYERENSVNLWFVVTAGSRAKVVQVLDEIRSRTGLAVLDLRMLTSYHIDLGFPLADSNRASDSQVRDGRGSSRVSNELEVDEHDRALVHLIAKGIALEPRPYERIASLLGLPGKAVRARLERLIAAGAIKRFGLIVRHHELGYRDNAMTVWNIPDDRVDAIGTALAGAPEVTLCYRRARDCDRDSTGALLDWPFNLYCMVHGKDRDSVVATTDRLTREYGLSPFERARLFSTRRFKQRGALYDAPDCSRISEQSSEEPGGGADGRS